MIASLGRIVAGLSILFLPAAEALAHHGEGQARDRDDANLTPPGGNYYVRGTASNDGSIQIRAEGLPGGIEVEILIADAAGTFTSFLKSSTQADGKLEVQTSQLPDGVASLGELAGRGVKVVAVADGRILLQGSFPKETSMVDRGEGSTALKPPAGAPFPEASGRARVKARDGRHSLEVKVRDLADGEVFTVRVTSLSGQTEIVGQITTHGGGNGALQVDSDDGGSLPLASGSIADLSGATVEVIDPSGQAVLAGTLPALGQDEANENEVQVEIEFPETGSGPGGDRLRGSVRFKTEKGAAEVRLRIKNATPGAAYDFTIRPPESTDRSLIARLTAGTDGEAEVNQEGADVLPLHAEQIANLAGDILEVVDSEGKVLLTATVPATPRVERPVPVERLRLAVVLARPEGSSASANGKLEVEEEDDEHEIELEAQDLVPGAAYRTEIRRPSGEAETLVEGPADAFGDIRKRIDFLFNDRLPFGLSSLRALDGSTVVILDAEGAVVLQGLIAIPAGGGGAIPGEISFDMVGSFDAPFLRGDSNRDFSVDISDVVFTLGYLFQGSSAPVCADALDANDDSALDISDPINTLFTLYGGGLPARFPGVAIAGFDPSADRLFCRGN